VGKKRNAYKYLVGYLKERNHLEDLGVDGRMTLKWTLALSLLTWRIW
jgi:hypothetical protein